MKARRHPLEVAIQRDIELEIGAEPDLLLMKNSVGMATYIDEDTGRTFYVPYGLLTGSPDLVGILAPKGSWLALEVKRPGEEPTAEQLHVHKVWRRFGAIVEVVHSAQEARAALERARREVRAA